VEDWVPYGPGSEQLFVRLSGGDFSFDFGTHDHFAGWFVDDTVRFVLPDYDAVYTVTGLPFVIERLTPSTALVIAGEAELSGPLNGVIYVARLVTDRGFQTLDYRNPIATCRSIAHEFVLSR
jgi:hypothetical protein